jgi:cytochrome c oxidase subunit 4
MTIPRPPRILVLSWVALLALLALTVFGAYLPIGKLNTFLALIIATTKALIVAAIFMELRDRKPLLFAFASAGFFWLAILLWLALGDYVTRPNFPPSVGPVAQGTEAAAQGGL